MAYKYALKSPSGRTIEFESPTMLTREQAQREAARRETAMNRQQRELEATGGESRGLLGTARDLGLGLYEGAARLGETAGGLAAVSAASRRGRRRRVFP